MRHRFRAVFGGLIFALLLPLFASPASANHEFDHGYWTRPPIVVYDGQFAGNVQDAAYYWQDRGFEFGYYPPLPMWSHGGQYCTATWDGYINVCSIPRWILQPYCDFACDGVAQTTWIGDGQIKGAWVLVADDLSPSRRQAVFRHEMGHALGLGHWNDPSCVMHRDAPVLGETCQHDRDAMKAMYWPYSP